MIAFLVAPVSCWFQRDSLFNPSQRVGPMFPGYFHFRQVLAVTRTESQPLAQGGVGRDIAQRLVDFLERHRRQPQGVFVFENGLGGSGTRPGHRFLYKFWGMADEQLLPLLVQHLDNVPSDVVAEPVIVVLHPVEELVDSLNAISGAAMTGV